MTNPEQKIAAMQEMVLWLELIHKELERLESAVERLARAVENGLGGVDSSCERVARAAEDGLVILRSLGAGELA